METISSGNKNARKDYIAFFDLDQTIANSVSGKALVMAAYRKGLLKPADLIRAIPMFFGYRLMLVDPVKMIDSMVSWVKDIPDNKIENLCSEVFHDVILPSVYSEAIAEIESHKTSNARVVILSSALTCICEKMASFLSIDDFICTNLEVENGYLTGRPVGHICFGENKAVRLKEYCESNNSLSSDAWYYGDSISDITALTVVGHPVCVNPDSKLKKEAIKREWRILNWKT